MLQTLSPDGLITVLILAVAIALFLTGRVRPDVVALLVLVSLGAAHVLSPQEVLSSFSHSAVVTIAATFVIAQGLFLTGASARVGDLLVRVAGSSEKRLVFGVMLTGAFLSFFMNNVAAASVLLPAVSATAARKNIYPSRLLMPLAFATILGGMATLFTTVNIIMSGLLRDRGLEAFGVLDFAPVGVPAALAGIALMVLWGRSLLPRQSAAERLAASSFSGPNLAELYRIGERLFRARIPEGSSLDGTTLSRSTLRERYGVNVVALERHDGVVLAPSPDSVLRTGDLLVLEGNVEEFRQKDIEPYLEIQPQRILERGELESDEIVVAEVILTPRSSLIGKKLRDINFRSKYGFTVLAIWRDGRPITRGIVGLPLQFGDALLIQGPPEGLRILHAEPDLILMSGEHQRHFVLRPHRKRISVGIAAGALLAAVLGVLPPAEAMLTGSVLMVLTGCLTIDEAYATIEWKTVLLVAGMLSLALALTKTGVAAEAAEATVATVGPLGPTGLLVGLFLLGLLLTQALGGPAVAAMLGPLALQAASQTGISPYPLVMAVAMAASMAFLSPLGHPVNMLVMGPGGYRFSDYFKVGLPLTLVVGLVVLIVLPLVWPLSP